MTWLDKESRKEKSQGQLLGTLWVDDESLIELGKFQEMQVRFELVRSACEAFEWISTLGSLLYWCGILKKNPKILSGGIKHKRIK